MCPHLGTVSPSRKPKSLKGGGGFYHRGVIAVVVAVVYTGKNPFWMKGEKKAIYIIYLGQTSLHLFGRASKHISDILGNGTEQEHFFHKVVKGNGGKWWEDFIFISLETIPLPDRNGQAPKPGTQDFVSEFRIRATPREQAWIQQLKKFRPHGLNVEVHTTSKNQPKDKHSETDHHPHPHVPMPMQQLAQNRTNPLETMEEAKVRV